MSDTETADDAVEQEQEDGTQDAAETDESLKAFGELSQEDRDDIMEARSRSGGHKATEVLALASQKVDDDKAAKEIQEQNLWADRENENKDTESDKDADDEPMTVGEFKKREKVLREEIARNSQAERDELEHTQCLSGLGITDNTQAHALRHAAEAHAKDGKVDLSTAYRKVAKSFGLDGKKSAAKDPVKRAIANTRLPAGASGRGAGETQASEGPELCSEEQRELMLKEYG